VDDELDQIAQGMKTGDEAAFARFVDLFGPLLFRRYVCLGLSLADAESLAVSSISDIAIRVDRFTPLGPGSFRRWAYQVARNLFREQLRKRRPELLGEGDEEVPLPAEDEDPPEVAQAVTAMRRAVQELTEPDRTIVLAKQDQPDLTFAEIGQRVRLAEGTARVRYHRALEKLRRLLADDPAVRVWQTRLSAPTKSGD
jgi:RNA polymerase sigma factor (sigma-70 family)